MSAPNTNVEKQKRRHKAPLVGMRAILIYAAILLIGLVTWTTYQGGTPEGAAQQIDGRTGAVVEGTGDSAADDAAASN